MKGLLFGMLYGLAEAVGRKNLGGMFLASLICFATAYEEKDLKFIPLGLLLFFGSLFLLGILGNKGKFGRRKGTKRIGAGGYIYVLGTFSDREICKVGLTVREVEKRLKELNRINYFGHDDWYVYETFWVESVGEAESECHRELSEYLLIGRHGEKEVFELHPSEAVGFVRSITDFH